VSVMPQHKLVVADLRFRIRIQQHKRINMPKTKWWKLKEEPVQTFKERVLKEDPWHEGGDANMWLKMVTCIRKVAKKTAKQAMSEERRRMYDGLYQRIGMKEGEKDIYKIAKNREENERHHPS
jgi:hypothetical protein